MKRRWLLPALVCASVGVCTQTAANRPPQKYDTLARQILGEFTYRIMRAVASLQ